MNQVEGLFLHINGSCSGVRLVVRHGAQIRSTPLSPSFAVGI